MPAIPFTPSPRTRQRPTPVLALLGIVAGLVMTDARGAAASETASETASGATALSSTCDELRASIGMLPLADADLLRAMAARKDCAFTSAEVYRAAYGDRVPAVYHRSEHRMRYSGHEDDD